MNKVKIHIYKCLSLNTKSLSFANSNDRYEEAYLCNNFKNSKYSYYRIYIAQ